MQHIRAVEEDDVQRDAELYGRELERVTRRPSLNAPEDMSSNVPELACVRAHLQQRSNATVDMSFNVSELIT